MTDQPDTSGSLFASPQSMGAFGSLPVPGVGPIADIEPDDELESVDEEE